MLVQLSVVDTAHRDSELVTDFAPERAWTRTTIGANCSIGQNVMIGLNVRVGNGCKIQNNVAIYDGVEPADDLFCGPTCVFTNVNNPSPLGYDIPRHDVVSDKIMVARRTVDSSGYSASRKSANTRSEHAYSTTSSARRSNDSGIVRSIVCMRNSS